MRTPHPRAFTLIELLVVVAIIAMLIAILIPSLSNARMGAIQAKGGSNIGQLGKAAFTYAAQNKGKLPQSHRALMSSSGFALNQEMGFRNDNGGFAPLWGSALATVLPDGVHSKLWVSPATSVRSPFDMLHLAPADAPNTWYELEPKVSKGNVAFFAFLFFSGDPGNVAAPIYFRDSGRSQPFSGLDHEGDADMGSYKPTEVLMQDLVMQDQSGVYHANYVQGALQQNNYDAGGFQYYYQGYMMADRLPAIRGANVLYANGSVSWVPSGQLVPVYTYDDKNYSNPIVFYVGTVR